MEITALTPQKKRKDRLNLYLDGEFTLGVSVDTVAAHSLKEGRELSQEEVEEVIREEELHSYKERALRYLSYRPRSSQEMCDYLADKGASSYTVRLVMDWLREKDYVDDEDFTRWWIEQRDQHKPRGKRALRSELYQKRVDRKIIDRVLREWEEAGREKENIESVYEKALKRYAGKGGYERRRKIWGYLARRGFSSAAIRAALDHRSDFDNKSQ